MKKMLSALLTLTVLSAACAAASIPQAVVMADARVGAGVYDHLFTECSWQGLALPAEVLAALGDPARMTLTAEDLTSNVKVALRPVPAMNYVGLSVSRKDQTRSMRQVGKLTLGNPLTGYSYTVQVTVAGDQRPEK